MKLSTFSDYSLRMLVYLAVAPQQRSTIPEVARAYDISEHHLVKVAHQLGRAGLLSNVRGRNGGVRLALPAAQINIGKVIRLTEDGDMPAECFDRERNTCRITSACRLRRALREAVEAFYAVLERYTLADVAHNPNRLAPLLGIRLIAA